MNEQKIEIETPQGKLTGTLILPQNYSGNVGLIVFVHGDGPINDTYEDGYKPLWEKFASAGYAPLSLNKPGIGGSSGNWLEQSGQDINVDIEETERIYREKIPANLLSVSYFPNADHSMQSKKNAASPLRTYLTAVFFPRQLEDDQYLNDLSRFVKTQP